MVNDSVDQSDEVLRADDHAGTAEFKLAMRYISSLSDGEGPDTTKLHSDNLPMGGRPPKTLVFKASGGYPKDMPVDPDANWSNWQIFNRAAESHPKYPLDNPPYPPAGAQIDWLSPDGPNYPANDSSELRSIIYNSTPRRDATILNGNYATDPTTPTMLLQTKEQLLQQTEEALSFGDDQIFYPVGGKNLPRSPTGSNQKRSRNRAAHQNRKLHSQVMGTPTPSGVVYDQMPTPVASVNGREHRTWSTPTMMTPDCASSLTQLHTFTPFHSLPKPSIHRQAPQPDLPDINPTTRPIETYPPARRITKSGKLKPESLAFTFAEPYTSSPDSTSSPKAQGDCIRFGTVVQSSNTVHHGHMQTSIPPRFRASSVLGQQAIMPSGFQAVQGNTFQSSFSIMNTPFSDNSSAYLQYPGPYSSQHQGVYSRGISRVGNTGNNRGVGEGRKRPKKYQQYPSSSELAFNFTQAQK